MQIRFHQMCDVNDTQISPIPHPPKIKWITVRRWRDTLPPSSTPLRNQLNPPNLEEFENFSQNPNPENKDGRPRRKGNCQNCTRHVSAFPLQTGPKLIRSKSMNVQNPIKRSMAPNSPITAPRVTLTCTHASPTPPLSSPWPKPKKQCQVEKEGKIEEED